MRTLCLSSSLYTHTHTHLSRLSPHSSFILTPHTRSHFLTPCSSLRHTQRDPKKQLGAKINTAPSDSALKRLFSPNDSQGDGDPADNTDSRSDFQDSTAFKGTLLAGFLLLGVIGGFASVGYIYRDQINTFLNQLSLFIEGLFFSLLIYLFIYSFIHSYFSPPTPLCLLTPRIWPCWICIIRCRLCWIGGINSSYFLPFSFNFLLFTQPLCKLHSTLLTKPQ